MKGPSQREPDSIPAPPRRLLGTWDVVSLILGIVVGVSIFRVPGDVFSLAGTPEQAFLIWGIGAALAFSGALCYCELAAAWPRFGGEYAYLTEAFGSGCGFLFAWLTMTVVLPGNIGAAAFIFADYAGSVHPVLARSPAIVAVSVITVLTGLQLLGFVTGKLTQNLLTLIKIIALGLVLTCGLLVTSEPTSPANGVAITWNWSELGLAFVFVFYAYGGWNDAAMVTPEVRNCRRNMPRALLLGMGLVALLYLSLNFVFWKVLGTEGVKAASAPAAAVMERAFGTTASQLMSFVVMASAMGAINGMIFSGCRLFSAVGEDFPGFRLWSFWNRRQVPVWSLLSISGMSVAMIALVGLEQGRQLIDSIMLSLQLNPPGWQQYRGGFNLLVAASAPVFWTFFMMSSVALIVLRWREPDRERPFRVPFYPMPVILFLMTTGYMLWSSTQYAGRITLLLLPVLIPGIGLALTLKRNRENSRADSASPT